MSNLGIINCDGATANAADSKHHLKVSIWWLGKSLVKMRRFQCTLDLSLGEQLHIVSNSLNKTFEQNYRLVWVTKLLLAVIGLVFPALVLGYKSFYCSMYHVPVPPLIEKFVWIYFKQLFTVAGSIIFWHTNSRSLQSIFYQFLCTFLNLYDILQTASLYCWQHHFWHTDMG